MTTESFDKTQLLPLCVDLDGTLIQGDTTWIATKLFCRRYPLKIYKLLVWLIKGRAHLKRQLANHIDIDPSTIIFHKSVFEYVVEQAGSRPLYLATATDFKFAKAITHHLPFFTGVIASDGYTNLRAHKKAEALNLRFGRNNYIYIGNSRDDLWVWRDSAEIYICSRHKGLLQKVKQMGKNIVIFEPK